MIGALRIFLTLILGRAKMRVLYPSNFGKLTLILEHAQMRVLYQRVSLIARRKRLFF